MSIVINNEHYERMSCGQCGVVFYVPLNFYEERRNDGDGWHCPNGHPRVFTEPKVKKLERQLEAKDKELARLKTDYLTHKMGNENREKRIVKLQAQLKKLRAKKKAGE